MAHGTHGMTRKEEKDNFLAGKLGGLPGNLIGVASLG